MQTKKKTTQPLAMRKLVGKGNNVSTSIKALTKESPKSWHIFVGRLHPATTAEELLICLIVESRSLIVTNLREKNHSRRNMLLFLWLLDMNLKIVFSMMLICGR